MTTRRLTAALTLVACLLALGAALLGPAQTLALTQHRASCPTSATHAKAGRRAHACVHSSHKHKARHAVKRHSGHALTKAPAGTIGLALPPALRITCASPSCRPRIREGTRRASMQASTATLRAGGSGSSALSKLAAYSRAFWSRSSVELTVWASSVDGYGPVYVG